MPDQWLIRNFITGKDEPLPARATSNVEPTEAWVQGWNDGIAGLDVNPYPDSTLEFHEWIEGYEAAQED